MKDNGRDPRLDHLPPPAFPPGSDRKGARSVRTADEPATGGAGVPDDALISPDDPIVRGDIPDDAFFDPDQPVSRSGTRMPEDAFFSPDEPVVRQAPPTKPEDFERVMEKARAGGVAAAGESTADEDGEEVVVTGIGLDTHVRADRRESTFDDPHVESLYRALRRLTKSVHEKGEAGLRTVPEMSRFEATLRGYCVGYLAGLREEPDPDG